MPQPVAGVVRARAERPSHLRAAGMATDAAEAARLLKMGLTVLVKAKSAQSDAAAASKLLLTLRKANRLRRVWL